MKGFVPKFEYSVILICNLMNSVSCLIVCFFKIFLSLFSFSLFLSSLFHSVSLHFVILSCCLSLPSFFLFFLLKVSFALRRYTLSLSLLILCLFSSLFFLSSSFYFTLTILLCKWQKLQNLKLLLKKLHLFA